MNDPCQLLAWDTNFFGKRIARANNTLLDEDYIERLIAWCENHSIECLYFLADAFDAKTSRLAEQYQFRFVDVRMILERELHNWTEAPDPAPGLTIRLVQPGDMTVFREIAKTSYTLSRFYFDTCFSREACASLYQTWIENSCQGYADRVLVAQVAERPVGYMTCHLREENKSGELGLLGIDPDTRGSGIGNSLVRAALQWFNDQECTRVYVVTQGRNIAAQRLFQRNGFLTKSMQLWYHKWFVECER